VLIREGVGILLRGALRQVGRIGPARQALHRVTELSRGGAVAFLRVRRLVPATARGAAHPDRVRGAALVAEELARALAEAKRSLTFVHAGEALAALRRGGRLPRGLAVLTFDESFAATAELALPVCRDLGVPALFFVTTGPLDAAEPETLWDSHIHAVVDKMAGRPLSTRFVDRPLATATAADRRNAARRLVLSLVSLDEGELGRRLHELDSLVGGRPAVAALDRMLHAEELRLLAREPLVAIGAHGREHFSLAAASDHGLHDELAQPRARLRELCGDAFVDVVSYPFGRPPWIDDRVIQAARAAGYQAGFTALPGVVRPGDDTFRLARLPLLRRGSALLEYEITSSFAALDEWMRAGSAVRGRGVETDG
jgi:peptidoglycan/xylan/chitin deacetylase (PgdA/CDA1 family)